MFSIFLILQYVRFNLFSDSVIININNICNVTLSNKIPKPMLTVEQILTQLNTDDSPFFAKGSNWTGYNATCIASAV